MTDTSERRDAVEALRQALRHAGHVMYSAASDVGRDSSSDVVRRACGEVVAAAHKITKSIDHLAEVERRETEQ